MRHISFGVQKCRVFRVPIAGESTAVDGVRILLNLMGVSPGYPLTPSEEVCVDEFLMWVDQLYRIVESGAANGAFVYCNANTSENCVFVAALLDADGIYTPASLDPRDIQWGTFTYEFIDAVTLASWLRRNGP